MKQKTTWDEKLGIVLLSVSAALLGVSVYLCFCNDIWYDELFTMGLGNQSLSGLISITARDVHPPLYYMIVKLALMMGSSFFGGPEQVIIAKLVSVLPFVFCLVYAVTKVRKHFGMLAAGLFSFLIITMPQMADYTVEIRMYGYAVFFITAGMLHAYELTAGIQQEKNETGDIKFAQNGRIDKKSYVNWIAVTIYAILALYTHYFAAVAAVMIYIYLFFSFLSERKLKQNILPYLCSGFVCVIGYLPWIVGVVTAQVGRVKDNYWIQPLSWRTLGGCVKFLFKPAFTTEWLNNLLAVVLFVLYGGLLAAALFQWLKKMEIGQVRKAFFLAGCVDCLLGIVIFGFVASFLVRPIFVYRYMLPAMGVFWLAFAIMLSNLKSRKALLLPILAVVVIVGLRDYRAFYGEEMWKKLQMESAEAALDQIEEDDIIIYNFDQAQGVVSYYLNNETYLWYGITEELIMEMYPFNHSLVEGQFSDEAGIAKIKDFLTEGKDVWFLGSGNAREEILQKWAENGLFFEEKESVMIERYWFNLYKISE